MKKIGVLLLFLIPLFVFSQEDAWVYFNAKAKVISIVNHKGGVGKTTTIGKLAHQFKKAGKKVVGAFYGHPGVFAWVPHNAIKQARELGFTAHMEPGISAEDCLYADLGIDPGTYGCQHYETSQFMFYKRTIDTAALLVLWQVGVAGDRSLAKFTTDSEYRKILVKLLAQYYPLDHEVILYEAATLPIQPTRIEYLPISALPDAMMDLKTTLVIPPSTKAELNDELIAELEQLVKSREAAET